MYVYYIVKVSSDISRETARTFLGTIHRERAYRFERVITFSLTWAPVERKIVEFFMYPLLCRANLRENSYPLFVAGSGNYPKGGRP